MVHLRQNKVLTSQEQDKYFTEVILPLFDKAQPEQILFSFLEKGNCIGYGGLVHINWADQNAEISFLLKTETSNENFKNYWNIFLHYLSDIAFNEMSLHKIFTYAFDVRPHLYEILEGAGFEREAILREHCLIDKQWKNVVIHSKMNNSLEIRKVTWSDSDIILEWANDGATRNNSFNNALITKKQHESWLKEKLLDKNCHYFLCFYEDKPAAFIRFDKVSKQYVIGINVNPDYRGKKISVPCIKLALKKLEVGSTVIAYIKPENLISANTFSKAGFLYTGLEKVKYTDALVYTIKI